MIDQLYTHGNPQNCCSSESRQRTGRNLRPPPLGRPSDSEG